MECGWRLWPCDKKALTDTATEEAQPFKLRLGFSCQRRAHRCAFVVVI
jgi:hypothetical protein